jgi:two-component system, OmpR family, sensor histidine kinase MprB
MTFRHRVVVLAAVAVAAAVLLGSGATYVLVRHELRDGVDHDLDVLTAQVLARSAAGAPDEPPGALDVKKAKALKDAAHRRTKRATSGPRVKPKLPPQGRLESTGYAQFIAPDGSAVKPAEGTPIDLEVTPVDRAVASGGTPLTARYDARAAGAHVRVLTTALQGGEAIQAVQSLEGVDGTLARLALVLGGVGAAGIALAVLLGWLVSRGAVGPVARLTAAAERVTTTRDLSERIEVEGKDELARLAGSLNAMLGALEESVDARRQLVADASHELRTPLTSLAMNIEFLAEDDALPGQDRERLLRDVSEQLGELGVLVSDLVELARDERIDPLSEEVRLDLVAEEAVERACRHAPERRFELRATPCVVRGVPGQLARAVNNLLDNAVKWSPAHEAVEVAVESAGVLTVRDHGPGIDPRDLPHVFERFYRARGARGLPGAGLGLAIVRHVADSHGGTVAASNAPGGGTMLALRLPAL